MSRERTTERITARLRDLSWPTAKELAADLHMKDNTVRGYLNQLVVDGVIERQVDETVHSPTQMGANRYRVRDVPLGPAEPTTEGLCKQCAESVFGDELRYLKAWVGDAAKTDHLDEEALQHYTDEATCDRCGGRRWG